MKDLRGKLVLITGAAGGFGQSMTRQFLQSGSRLILTDRAAEPLRQSAGRIAAALGAPDDAILGIIEADLADAHGCELLYRRALELSPFVDILVNNAGLAVYGPLPDVPQQRWELLMQVNLLAPMRLSAHFLPAMIERRSGHIVNVSSAAGVVGARGLTAYCASKFGLRGFSEALYADVRPYGVDVTAVYPFFARTPILESEQFGHQPRRVLPDRILSDPDEVIAALIKGIVARKLHVFPGAITKQLYLMQRVVPWAVPFVERLIDRAAARGARS